MSTYTIEKNIPIPVKGMRLDTSYPFADMNVGDSFLVPKERTSSARSNMCRFMKLNRLLKFRSITLEDGTARLWRIS